MRQFDLQGLCNASSWLQGIEQAEQDGTVRLLLISGGETITDGIILLRYAEMDGRVRRAITVLKMRGSDHDRRIRAFHITDAGMEVGEPIAGAGALVVRGPTQARDPD